MDGLRARPSGWRRTSRQLWGCQCHAGRRAGLRGADLWRGVAVRGGLCRLAAGARVFAQTGLPCAVASPQQSRLGAFTFTMTALPGTPSIQNAIPMATFGTTPFAAPGLGLIAVWGVGR